MPRRQQPGTPPGLPPIPAADDDEWSRGTISNDTQSTSLHTVIDDATSEQSQINTKFQSQICGADEQRRFALSQLHKFWATIQPSLQKVRDVLAQSRGAEFPPNLVPLSAYIPADLLTPTLAYLKIAASSRLSFLYESAATTETIGRYSFVGADPKKVLKTGPGHGPECDPLPILEKELGQYRVANIPELRLPPLTAGAIGYVGYDCIRYFEPKTARPLKDILQIPESLFMLFDTIIAFDHFFQVAKVVTYIDVPGTSSNSDFDSALESSYEKGREVIQKTIDTLLHPDTPMPPQDPIIPDQEYTSNIGQEGYERHVNRLKEHINKGDIFQAVPSQRLARPTSLHPFNLFRHLRTVNPSPYLFYIDCADFQIIGASPELLVKEEAGRIITHPIAGTVKRGKTPDEDELLASELRNSLKDRAEHVMLVDLARNDVNRVCDPTTTQVDRLMVVEKFSHVQHLVSQVSGVLRPDQTRFDAFRSIFPAGTVSGAPKVKAMELISELEGEKRGVYAGAVGYFGFNSSSSDGKSEVQGAMDTCIALRTMMVKDGVAYLQAGGGIVFDSDPEDEYVETLNKLGANIQCIKSAEERYRK
ncbi:anthranilate synthase component 1 [Arachnomyces sp. PD_36]|nr:anthranilate synthase component 1 [Arachnomyces sp. PD_36]